jgi:hypothetical protein
MRERVAVGIINDTGRITDFASNNNYHSSIPPEDLPGMGIYEFLDTPDAFMNQINQSLSTGRPFSGRYTITRNGVIYIRSSTIIRKSAHKVAVINYDRGHHLIRVGTSKT